ncbi:ataxin-1-like [Lytechinus pictus]|uniref:ataxin-1-like n=1 Tax=Lytechinus pictus TaxID=7653 RepID=UPI0030B9F93E
MLFWFISGSTEIRHHHPPGHAETTRTSPSTQQHPSSHQQQQHHHHPHHHSHHHHHQRHSKGNLAPTASPASGSPSLHQPTNTLPSYFTRGSIIQLANSVLKRVEDLTTDDFVQSAGNTEGLKIDSSTVLRIDEEPHRGLALIGFLVGEHKAQVTVEAPYEHPFFVFGQGWSSVRPELSLKCYGLQCHTLAVGDVCVSLTVIENGKHGLKEDSEIEKHHTRMQVQGMSSPDMKRRRMEEKLQKSEEHLHAPGLTPSVSSHSSPSPGQQQMEHQVHPGGGPYEVPDHGIDKNSNIVPDKPLEMPHMKLMRPPKRRWSDPIKANQEAAAAAAAAAEKQQGQHHPVAPETIGKVQQQLPQ